MTGIYAIENIVNHKIYVGQSLNVHTRFLAHKSCLRRKCHQNEYLQRAWNKYGEKNFKFYMLEECCNEKLNVRETYWCQYFKDKIGKNNVYNLGHTGQEKTMSEKQKTKISNAKKEFYKKHPEALVEMSLARIGEKNAMYGKSSRIGKHHTLEVRQKLSAMKKGTKMSAESSLKKSQKMKGSLNPMFGKTHSLEARKKISEAAKNRNPISEETRHKISVKNKGRIWINNGYLSKMIQPNELQIYLDNNWICGRLAFRGKEK